VGIVEDFPFRKALRETPFTPAGNIVRVEMAATITERPTTEVVQPDSYCSPKERAVVCSSGLMVNCSGNGYFLGILQKWYPWIQGNSTPERGKCGP
jgi:hypothetical protein